MTREWSRRVFIQRGALGGLLLGAAGAGVLGLWKGASPVPGFAPAALDAHALAVLAALSRRLVPLKDGFPSLEEVRLLQRADAFLARVDEKTCEDVRRVLLLFDNALVSLLLGGPPKPFTELSPERQDAVLRDWEGSALALRRSGFQALRALISSCYFGAPESWAAVGYPGPPEGFHQPAHEPWRGGGVPRPPEEP